MKRFLASMILFSFLIPSAGFGQLKSNQPAVNFKQLLKFGLNPIGLVSGSVFSPEKFQMQQSYSFIVSSFNGHAISQAMYLNTMRYKVSDPLTLSLQWGYLMNQPFSQLSGLSPNLPFRNGLFLSSAKLEYKLGNHTKFQMEFNRYPGGYYSPLMWDDR
ncbi:hypothetical protein BMS3Abin05_00535 [bacterium BMS3Abin05]|nr:hypothetical protein BMS3Abin05_00535 [bacterium BMS3Abin05]GBE28625.1 hypothetical protein BMS3Bbin03_02573 [bacterium BMS3Bbin03]HDK35476.1 hypothetical protein [Bacteroidota bacterium]HDL78162.1 hypothetical protein [Bacteroidota bacterium]